MEFSLSSRGISGIPASVIENDFTFIVGDFRYYCSKFQACFISPKISQICSSDSNVNQFEIAIDDSNQYFKEIIKIMNGISIKITDQNIDFLTVFSRILGNSELMNFLVKQQSKPLAIETVIARTNRKVQLFLPIDDEIEFIASHISDFPDSALKQLESITLYQILSHSSVLLKSEEWLLTFIINLINERGSECRFLLGTIRFENISETDMRSFIDIVEPEDISGPLWKNLSERLLRRVSVSKKNFEFTKIKFVNNVATFSPSTPERLCGIVSHMIEECEGNPHDSGLIEVSASSQNENHPAKNVFDLNNMNYFESNNEPESWIAFDFKERKAAVSHYVLKTWFWGAGFQHLKSWVLEGSDDGAEWTELDRRENVDSLNDANAMRRFKCAIQVKCRYVRIKSIDFDHSDTTNLLILNAVEFYGKLFE